MTINPAQSEWCLFTKERRASATVRRVVYESWLRCANAGLDPNQPQLPSAAFAEEQPEFDFVALARPYLEFMASSLRGHSFIAALLDRKGKCIEWLGDGDMLQAGGEAGFGRHTFWNEETLGTNGPGTCMVTRSPVIISGFEHYRRTLHHFVSLGAPVLGPSSEPVGAFALVFPAERADPARLTAIVAAARAVERELCVAAQEVQLAAIRKSMVEAGLIHVVVVDSEGRIMDSSQRPDPVCGGERECPPPGFISGQHPAVKQALATGKKVYQRCREGDDHEYEVLSVPLVSNGSLPFGAVTLAVDRTQEALLSRRLEESSAVLLSFSSVEDILITIVDPECRIVHASRFAARILGADSGELVGRHMREFFGPSQKLAVESALIERRAVVIDQWLEGRDGARRFLHVLAVPVNAGNRLVGAVALGVDMTSAHEAVQRASRAESILRALFESPEPMACLTDPSGEILELSESAARRLGGDRQSIIGTRMADYAPADSEFFEVLRSGRPYYGVKRSKRFGCLRSLIVPVCDADGAMLGVLTLAHDGTEEEKVQSLKAGLFSNQFVGVIVIDSDRLVCEINDCALRLVHATQGCAIGRPVSNLFTPSTQRALSRYLDSGTLSPPILEEKRDGEQTRWIEVTVTPVTLDDAPAGAVVFVRDVTERVLLVNRSRRIEQLEMVGELATIAAHEFRNPLSAMRAAAQVGLSLVPPDQPRIAELFRKIEQYVDDLNESIEQILYLGRPESKPLRPGAVVPILEQAMESVEHLARSAGIVMDLRCSDVNLSVMMEPKALSRAVSNLLHNAIQAMRGGGYIEITAQPHGEDEVEISLHDTGPGIPESVRNRLFEPFFTTRADGNGLGLPIVHQIITEIHGGTLQVFSEEGEGTVVLIRLAKATLE